jgi:hypothetical protein
VGSAAGTLAQDQLAALDRRVGRLEAAVGQIALALLKHQGSGMWRGNTELRELAEQHTGQRFDPGMGGPTSYR